MLIFVVTPLFPNTENKQQGIYVYEQCKALEKQGNKVVVLNISPVRWNKWHAKSCRKIQEHHKEGLEIYTLNPRGLLTSKLPRYSIFSAYQNLMKLYRKAELKYGKPDILHSHFTFPAGFAASKLSKKIDVPFVVTEHYSLFLKPSLHEYTRKILSDTIENASEFICVSDNLKAAIERWTFTNKKIKVIPNLVDDRFVFHNYGKIEGKFVFFSAGNLTRGKRFDLLIEAFCSAFKKDEDVYLYIAGDGKEYGRLSNLIVNNSRQKQIQLIGRLDRDGMLNQYIASDCFVLPSDYETFGIVYREAMAVGRPVISTKNGGIEENWEDKFGLLISAGDKQSLANAMVWMYENIEKYDFEYISAKCLERHSSRVVGYSIHNALKNVAQS